MRDCEFLWILANIQPATHREIYEVGKEVNGVKVHDKSAVDKTALRVLDSGYVVRRERVSEPNNPYEYIVKSIDYII